MTGFIRHPASLAAALISALVATACDGGKKTRSEYEQSKDSLKAENIEMGPIRHKTLPDDLDARIRKFSAVFAEVYPCSHEEWVDGFQRDKNPENEVVIWEHMASAYSRFLESNEVGAAARNEAFGLLLVRSGTEDVESSLTKLKALTREQAKSLLSHYQHVAKPVVVKQREEK